ncbi:MAG: hypothetical protein WKF75_13510 [Singulisphaera sp.]
MNLRLFLSRVADRIWGASLACVIVGTALAFGGAVWWSRPVIAALTALFVLAGLLRLAVEREVRVLKSPLTALGVLALGLATAQLSPCRPRSRGPSPPDRTTCMRKGCSQGTPRPMTPRSSGRSRPGSALRSAWTARRRCDGWRGPRSAWRCSGGSRNSPIGWPGCTWSGDASSRRMASTRRSPWCNW